MNKNIPSLHHMRKYREMGFDRHHILEAWDQCKGRESSLIDTLKRIRSRDQLCSEQRLVWDGNKRGLIKRVLNQTPLKRLATRNHEQEYPCEEFQIMKKKGLLLKKEYRSMRGLSLEYKEKGSANEDIERFTKEMKGYLRRVKHLSIEFEFCSGWMVDIAPLLKSIRHNFVGLVSLKLSLKKVLSFKENSLSGFERLFAQLRPTLKHLDLDFADKSKPQSDFPEILGWSIMRHLSKLETLYFNFRNTRFPITLVKFFINIACRKMRKLRSLSFQMENCSISREKDLSQASTPSNLRCLKLDFDHCTYLDLEYVSNLQRDILVACPALKELFIRLPNYKRFSGKYLSAMKEEFLQKLNLKKFGVELSHALEETWDDYQDVQAIENYQGVQAIKTMKERKFDEFVWDLKQRVGGEENFHLYCETMIDEENEEFFEGYDEQDYQIFVHQCYIAEVKEYYECKEIEEQEEAERIFHGYLTKEEEWQAEYGMEVMFEVGCHEEGEEWGGEDEMD